MDLKRWSLPIRILIAIVVAFIMLKIVFSGVPKGGQLSPMDRWIGVMLFMLYGGVLFSLFGIPLIRRVGEKTGTLYMPSDSSSRIVPEYSVAEARVKEGRYQEAIDEYRQVIEKHPDDIYAHLRIADVALQHLNDPKTAELELTTALAKAEGEDSAALAAGRLADLYHLTLHDPARALGVMKQLREKIPDTKQAKLAEERITVLEGMVAGTVQLPTTPDKIIPRPSRYKMSE